MRAFLPRGLGLIAATGPMAMLALPVAVQDGAFVRVVNASPDAQWETIMTTITQPPSTHARACERVVSQAPLQP